MTEGSNQDEHQDLQKNVGAFEPVSFEKGLAEIAGLVFGSVMEYSVKPTVAKLMSMAFARKVVRRAGCDTMARVASHDPEMDAAYADISA